MKSTTPIKYWIVLLSYSGVLLVFLLVINVLLWNYQSKQIKEEAYKHFQSEIELIGTVTRNALRRNDYSLVELFLLQWGNNHKDVVEIEAVGSNGFILTHFKRKQQTGHTINLEHRVISSGKVLLTLKMIDDISSIRNEVNNFVLLLSLGSVLLTSILGLSLWYILRITALIPMEQEIAKRKQAEEAILNLNESLEQRIAGRTIELTKKNEKLAAEISEREKIDDELQRNILEKTTLHTMVREISSSRSVDNMTQAVLKGISISIAPDLTLLFLLEGDNLLLQGSLSNDPRFSHKETPVHHIGECLCGMAIKEGKPVYSYDINNDPRCTWEECKKAGLLSFCALPLLREGKALGILGLASRTKKRDFKGQAIYLETISKSISVCLQNFLLYEETKKHSNELDVTNKQLEKEITIRRHAEVQIEASLKEKEVLLKEIHHRVKNNMQIISSLIKAQAENVKEERYVEMFDDCQNRIKAMSLIHEKLYRSEDLANIKLNDYVKDLVDELFRSYRTSTARIKLKMNLDDITIGIETSIPCGLIINELISNTLKYAFPEDREGEIEISLRRIADFACLPARQGLQNADLKPEVRNPKSEMLELIFSDNGVGIPEDIDFRNTESLGLRLIFNLSVHQLDGKVELDRSNGTEFRIVFKEIKHKKRI